MHKPVSVALDAMSGDRGAEIVVPAAIAMLADDAQLRLILTGQPDVLTGMLGDALRRFGDRLAIEPAVQIVDMDEHPKDALRKKKDSSMRVALNLVRDGRAGACVSSGNTGALMATARFVLRTLPGIDRPAIISAVPSIGGHTHMLDLGANADCTPEQLFQFAVMGTIVAADIHGLKRPRVGLLNIGAEDIKGNDRIREAARLLTRSNLNYIGFVEGNDIFLGTVDVVVTDGFTGNVSLKTMEGLAQFITAHMRAELSRTRRNRLLALVAMPMLKSLKSTLDTRRYNGASLVGLNGIVIKSHGDADVLAFRNAIRTAIVEIDKGVPRQISHLLGEQVI
ncbi:MAG TPA: phosphate acyltransferase PlsX [Gammaproteobacteria bacterium]|nr:phosphate acyltransferase PlsX [Gammaproteobacteria bacterium]